MASATIDKEIRDYLPLLNAEQKEAILTVMKTFAQEPFSGEYDEEFESELKSRFAEYENGNVQGLTLEETENRARERTVQTRNNACLYHPLAPGSRQKIYTSLRLV